MGGGSKATIVGLAATALVVPLGLTVLAAGSGSAAAGQAAAGAVALSALAQNDCVASGPVPSLSAAQAANAEVIVAVANTLGAGQRGAQLALMTAMTESSLTNDPPGVGGGGSVGLFQQIATDGWGTVAQEEDPTQAAGMFVQRLLTVPGWSTIPPWQAAQAVQRSGAGQATDGAANYGPNWQPAATLLASVDHLSTTSATCGQGAPGSVPAGPAANHGLPTDYSVPATATPTEVTAITYALAQLGKGYVWAAAGPDVFDCSGLTMMAWAAAGVTIDHYTGTQLQEGSAVPGVANISPGDLVLIPGSDGTVAAPGHVGIYLGYGLVESAVDPAQGIIVQTWANFTAGGLSGIRHLG
ncbi:MAG: C40 family peptidase [Acidimicrobiales bacterium]